LHIKVLRGEIELEFFKKIKIVLGRRKFLGFYEIKVLVRLKCEFCVELLTKLFEDVGILNY
jgi:hypothetical protein